MGVLALLAAPWAWAQPRRLPPIDDDTTRLADREVTVAAYQPLIATAWDGVGDPTAPRYEVGGEFDKGLYIRGVDGDRDPFSMYIGARLQLRHTGFTRSEETWTDSAGVTRPIRNRNNFDAERVRLNISGTALDPAMTYYFVFDGDADGGSDVDLLAYIFTYEVDPALRVRFGRWKVASNREWLTSSRFLSLADRAMATEFFRVGFSDGVWLLGDLGDAWHYEASLTNGLRSSTRRPFDQDDNLAVAATVFCDPLGPYGPGFADYACHADPVIRYGASFAFNRSDDRSDAGFPSGDNNFVSLSDGTRLSDVGALGPGVRLLSDKILEGAVDFSMKWRGWALSSELFVRSIQDLTVDGPVVDGQIDDYGYRVDGGVFLVPKRLDLWGRVSSVLGDFGDAYEYAVGFNYYWGSGEHGGELDDRVNKFTFDVTLLDGSPVTATTADLIAGDTGVLFRTQMQFGF